MIKVKRESSEYSDDLIIKCEARNINFFKISHVDFNEIVNVGGLSNIWYVCADELFSSLKSYKKFLLVLEKYLDQT